MCNAGKYSDRNPGIRAAGIPSLCGIDSIEHSMKVYPSVELADFWFKSLCPRKEKTTLFPSRSILQSDTLHEVLAPELQKSRFVKFKEDFFEDLYLKKPKLGKATLVHCIPDDVTNENTTFGIRTERTEDLYNLVLPQKSVADVNREYIDWHSKYLISHQHYLPGERIHRNYNENFKPNASFGKTTVADLTGGQVKRCLTPKEKLSVVKDLQKYYLEKNFDDVGKKICRFKDPHLEDRNRVFGRPPNSNKCTLRDIVHNINPCEEDTELLKAIAYLIHQRGLLQKDAQFDVFELEKSLERQDKDKTGYIPLATAFKQARSLHIFLNEHKMRKALIFYKLVEDIGLPTERIKIEDFSKILQFRYLLPEIAVKRSNPGHKLSTTYRDMCIDYHKPLPPVIPHFKKHEDEAEASLSPEDFDRPREKAQLKRIFSEIVCSDTFERIWNIIKQKLAPENDLISINAFRAELRNQREMQAQAKVA